MFSYQNKVVGITISEISEFDTSDTYDILINNQYVATTNSNSIYLIGSTNDSINFDPAQSEAYYFSELALNEGVNALTFSKDGGSGGDFDYMIHLYDLSGSYLINAYEVETGTLIIDSGSGSGIEFTLTYPTPGGSINLFEFDPVFDVDTGNLNQVFTGSGIHLQKDVTFFFDILDQQLNTVSSNQQFLENPLISGCVFDVVDINGNTVAPNFFTGKYSRSVTVSALDNENIFGTYQKDFGVRCSLPNSFDGSTFTGVFLAYGNVPNILDIVPNHVEFSGAPQATESFSSSVVLQNDLRFTRMDRYDVYALTGSGSAVNELTYLNPTAQEGYLFSQSAINVSDVYTLTINKNTLTENIPYYFTVVPYGVLGSGKSIKFGPVTFVDTNENAEYIPLSASELNLVHGSGQSSNVFLTGSINSSGLIHTFDTGIYTTAQYLIEIKCPDNTRRSSKLIGVVNPDFSPPNDLSLFHDVLNNTGVSAVSYSLTGVGDTSVGLYVSGVGGLGTYKFQATLI